MILIDADGKVVNRNIQAGDLEAEPEEAVAKDGDK